MKNIQYFMGALMALAKESSTPVPMQKAFIRKEFML
jgi:hypothetical protein